MRSSFERAPLGVNQDTHPSRYDPAIRSAMGTSGGVAPSPYAGSTTLGTFGPQPLARATQQKAFMTNTLTRVAEQFGAKDVGPRPRTARYRDPRRTLVLPMSASSALSLREDFVPAVSEEQDILREEVFGGRQPTMEELLDEKVDRRVSALIARALEEFHTGSKGAGVQPAFTTLGIARSVSPGHRSDLDQMMALVALAAGNYTQGGHIIRRMMETGRTPFPEDMAIVESLYSDPKVLDGDLKKLGERMRAYQSGADEGVLQIFGLWCLGRRGDARAAAQAMANSPDSNVSDAGKGMLEAIAEALLPPTETSKQANVAEEPFVF